MNTPRFSIFARIMLATFLPLLLVFSIVLVSISHITYETNIKAARERSVLVAQHTAAQAEESFNHLSHLLQITCGNIAATVDDNPINQKNAEEFILSLMQASEDIYCAWLIVEEDFSGDSGRYGFSFLRTDNGISPVRKIRRDMLENPDSAPWFAIPLRTKAPFAYTHLLYDFDSEKGPECTGGYSYPIIHKDRLAAVAGIDILYHKSFDFLRQWEVAGEQRMFIVSGSGLVLYSSDPEMLYKPLKSFGFSTLDLDKMYAAIRDGAPLSQELDSPLGKGRVLQHLSPIQIHNAETPLYLLSETPVASLYKEAEKAFASIVFLGGLGLLAAGASIFFTTRSIVAPIKRLTAKAEMVAQGDLRVMENAPEKLRPDRHEIDQLERSLEKMMEQVAKLHAMRIFAMEAQHAREKLEQTAVAKDRFFANMSHEIRTPMNAILGMSELLLNEPLEESEAKYVCDIKTAAESLLSIVNDILDLSKLESGNLSLLPVHYDVRALLDNIQSLSRYLALEKGLTFRMEIPDDIPLTLYGDDIRLKQVLLNVIGNAVKFTQAGEVSVLVQKLGDYLLFDVADTGVGIKAEDRKGLFTPFTQLDMGKHRGTRGSGLGLSISRNLLELMGGSISVDSEYGKGSVFHIRVPIVPGDPDRVERRKELVPIQYRSDSRALVVDDNRVNLEVAAGLLRLHGIACDTAMSGGEGIEMLEKTSYDIVFMDHMMPEMDGIEATAIIRGKGGRFAEQTIVALTANAVIGKREEFLRAGMNDFLSKPIVKERLRDILAKWMPSEKRVEGAKVERLGRDTLVRVKPVAREKKSVSARLAAIDGLDSAQGFERLGDIYPDVLGTIGTVWNGLPEKLAGLIACGNLTDLRIEIHGAKGALANIGATTLADMAARIEDAAAQGKLGVCERETPEFLEKFAKLVQDIETGLAGG